MASDEAAQFYPRVEAKPDFPAIERKVLAFWKEEGIFERSVSNRPVGDEGKNEYVFYDGPPFANGLPHYGHLLTGFVKDIVPRYQTMLGRRVERRFGWDCHGLPAEMAAEKELGISGRQQITEHGIDRFNDHCRQSVLRYTQEWRDYVTRQARWVDFDHDYKTMDLSYMESVMWAFKTLWDKGLIYEGYRVMPYSWAAESPVSNFETRMDNSYRPRQDPAITVAFAIEPTGADPEPLEILVWTTTPWTLPSNLALCVGAGISYAIMREGDRRFVLAEAALGKYAKELSAAEQVGTISGSDLVGRTYRPLFPYFSGHDQAASFFRILAGDFVDTEEGTGVVHLAPGFGEDDQAVCAANGIAVVCPVDDRGRFTAEVTDYVGMQVFEANKPIIKRLKDEGRLVRHETYVHNYPHCWRTDEPLIYKALSSWYVKVTDFRERMVELNREINWIPGHIKDGQFGKWLEGAKDWSISRNRFWGAPIPVWRSDDPNHPRIDVYGSLAEIERDFGVRLTDLHRPTVDQLVRPNPDDPSGKSMMRRVPDVLDCWFESGSMPFAQVHYPFENKAWFENHFPADFIVEYIAQTRGWFYTMMVLGTALFDRPPFLNCICHGVVVDEDGKKLSKRLRNYPSPEEVFSTVGADALRWFLVSSPILRGSDLAIDREGKGIAEVVRLIINPIWNAWYFFSLYANSDGLKAERRADQEGRLDRYILAKTRQMIGEVEAAMGSYELAEACAVIRRFMDALNNWYIRRSRDRFWAKEKTADKQDAYDTLYTVLETLCRVVAPFLPLLGEEVWRGLTGGESVHLADWPEREFFPEEADLVADMDHIREVCSAALGLRKEAKVRTRQPLRELVVAGRGAERLAPFLDLVRDEVNVKEVGTGADLESMGDFKLSLNARVLGPKLGPDMKTVLAASRSGDWSRDGDGIRIAGHRLDAGEFELKLEPKAGFDAYAITALPSNDALVALDVSSTPELEREGLARDLVRLVQMARRDLDLDVTRAIRLEHDLEADAAEALAAHLDHLREQTLASEVVAVVGLAGEGVSEQKLGGGSARLRIVPL
ncbi:MAG: isoleucine--tRNA ligase [Planctomycetes bacterium]|nr:isoleucine--tRNA ligase [Planctomycetota bacterium]